METMIIMLFMKGSNCIEMDTEKTNQNHKKSN